MASAPKRSCAVCRKQFPQAQLQRWTVVDGVAVAGQQDGRGYYSCPNCADKAKMVVEGRDQARKERNNDKRRA